MYKDGKVSMKDEFKVTITITLIVAALIAVGFGLGLQQCNAARKQDYMKACITVGRTLPNMLRVVAMATWITLYCGARQSY